jgi:hypothetical protein
MQMDAETYGTAESTATAELPSPEKLFTIWGSQKATP